MEAGEYSKIIAETAVYPKRVHNFGLIYTFIGIHDELEEVFEDVTDIVNTRKEKFDVVWHVCAFTVECGQSFEDLINEYFSSRESGYSVAFDPLYGKIKKFYRDKKKLDWPYIKKHFLLPLLHDLFYDFTREEFEKGLKENYDKLISRRQKGTLHGDGNNR